MSIDAERITVTSTATLKHTAKNGTVDSPRGVTILANTTNTDVIHVGGNEDDTDTTHGFPLTAGDSLSLDLIDGDEIWMISSANSPTCQIIYTRV